VAKKKRLGTITQKRADGLALRKVYQDMPKQTAISALAQPNAKIAAGDEGVWSFARRELDENRPTASTLKASAFKT
jgi:hypothetical protein